MANSKTTLTWDGRISRGRSQPGELRERGTARYPGDTTLIQEKIHPVWTSTVLEQFKRDVAYAFRTPRSRRLLPPLPYRDPD